MRGYLLLIILNFLCSPALRAQAETTADSLKSILHTQMPDSSRLQTLNEIAEAYSDDYKLMDSSLHYAQLAYNLANRQDDAQELARAAYNLAYGYDLDGKVDLSLEYYEKARQYYANIDSLEMVATCMHGKGIACYFQQDYGQSLIYYHEALAYARENNLREDEANTLLNLGVVYRILENYEKAIEIYEENILLRKQMKDSVSLAKVYNNLAVVYTHQKDYQKAIVYLDSCIWIYQILPDSFNLAAAYITTGDTYYEQGLDFDLARNYLLQGYGIMKGFDDNVYQSRALLYLGKVELASKKSARAIDYLEEGLLVLEDVEYDDIRRDILNEIAKAYANTGQTKKAYDAIQQSYALNETIKSEERIKYTEEMEVKYETEKKEKEIATLNAQKTISDLKLTNTRRVAIILILALAILGMLLFGFYRLYVKYKAQSKIIGESLAEKERLLENLKNAQEQIIRSEKMASLGQLTASIAHEINNPINFISSSAESLQIDFQELTELLELVEKAEGAEAEALLSKIIAQRDKIDLPLLQGEIQELLNGMKEGAERTTTIIAGLKHFSHPGKMEKELADIHQSLNAALGLIQAEFNGVAHIEKDYGTIPMVWVTRNQLSQVFINILTNALDAIRDKQVLANDYEGLVQIKTGAQKGEIFISIRDNGKGIPLDLQQKIFDPFYTTKDIGVGLGLGLSISYGIIEKHKGRIELKSEEGTGTEMTIWLPAADS